MRRATSYETLGKWNQAVLADCTLKFLTLAYKSGRGLLKEEGGLGGGVLKTT